MKLIFNRKFSCDMALFFLITASYFLHLLRNIFSLYGVFPLILSLVGCLVWSRMERRVDRQGVLLLLVYLFVYFLPVVYSYFWFPLENYNLAIIRYYYLIPFLFVCVFWMVSYERYLFVLKIFGSFSVLAGMSIFYQILFGPISWFPDASERESLQRFSSLMGSLTAYGIYGGMGLSIIWYLFKNKALKILFSAIVFFALLSTLQKAAVINCFLFLISLVYFSKGSHRLLIILLIMTIFPLTVFILYFFETSYVVATVDNVLRLNEGSGMSDVSMFQSIIDRLWFLPSRLFELYGYKGLFFGVGLVGGSGSLGFVDYPMAHNGFFDLIFIGGIINLFVFIIAIFFVVYRLYFIRKNTFDSNISKIIDVSIYLIFLFVVNMLFSGPLYIHPYGGVIFYSILVFVFLYGKGLSSSVNKSIVHI